MGINPDKVGATSAPARFSWSSRDAIIYALGVGAGVHDLPFTIEKDQQVLPTYAVIPGMLAIGAIQGVGDLNFAMMVHGEQGIRLHADLPVDGTVDVTGEITGIWDKGSGALIEFLGKGTTPDGQLLFETTTALFFRGEGGFGGERGPGGSAGVPDRAPDHKIDLPTSFDQALLYRLSGDTNPVHSDPEMARMVGFDRPILHGLCTYGFAGRGLLQEVCGGDPSRFGSMSARFTKPVYPGQTLVLSIWDEGDEFAFQAATDVTVLDAGRFSVRSTTEKGTD